MRLNAACLLGTLSAAAILAACAERRTYDDQITTSNYDRDRGYSSGWTSGSYVAATRDTTYQGNSGSQSGYQSGYGSGYQSNNGYQRNNVDNTNRVSGYGSSDSYNTGTSSSTTYGGTNSGVTNPNYNNPNYNPNSTGNQPYTGNQPSTGNENYGGTSTTGGGFGSSNTTGGTYEKSGTLQSTTWSSVKSGIAVFHATEGNTCKGSVRFTPSGNGLHVSADLEGLRPNQKIALRIHEFGDCSADNGDSTGETFGTKLGTSTGSTTYNGGTTTTTTTTTTTNGMSDGSMSGSSTSMSGTDMSNMSSMNRTGELLDLTSDASGRLHIDKDLSNISLVNGDNAVLGRSVVLETVGDTGTNGTSGTTMNTTGVKIACGVIGIGK